MRLAASLVICLATLVCAREWVTTTEIESQRLDEDDEAASSMEEVSSIREEVIIRSTAHDDRLDWR